MTKTFTLTFNWRCLVLDKLSLSYRGTWTNELWIKQLNKQLTQQIDLKLGQGKWYLQKAGIKETKKGKFSLVWEVKPLTVEEPFINKRTFTSVPTKNTPPNPFKSRELKGYTKKLFVNRSLLSSEPEGLKPWPKPEPKTLQGPLRPWLEK